MARVGQTMAEITAKSAPGLRADVFLSHHWRDHEQAERIALFLKGRGLTVFAERWYREPIMPWPQALEKYLSWCQATVLCIGPGELGTWQQREVRQALDFQAKRPQYPVIPVLLPGADPAMALLSKDPWIDLRDNPDDAVQLARLETAIRGTGVGAEGLRPVPASRSQICPYRGLLYFREQDTALFFGRDKAIAELHTALLRNTMVAVVGVWGSGKSSLVRAGLVPRLRRDREVGWEIATLMPGEHPLRALAAALAPLLEPEKAFHDSERLTATRQLADRLADGSVFLRDVVVRILEQQPGSQLLLLVADQWEELYTMCRSPLAWRAFVGELLDATAHAPLRVVLTLRADFVAEAFKFRPLEERLRGAQVRLGPLGRPEMRDALVQPAALVGLSFEEGLVERILDDTGDAPDNLPLLQFALRRLWEERQDNCLRQAPYVAMGGLLGAMADSAQRFLDRLPPPDQQIIRHLFLELVRPDEQRHLSRRRYRLAELSDDARSLAARLVGERLLAINRSEETGQETIEIAHEALIRTWTTLRQWLDQDMDFLIWRERLRVALADWERARRPAERLLRGDALAAAKRWIKDHPDRLTQPEHEFIKASTQDQAYWQKTWQTQGQEVAKQADRLDVEQRRHAEENALREEAKQRQEEETARARAARRRTLLTKAVPLAVAVVIPLLLLLGWHFHKSRHRTFLDHLGAAAQTNIQDHFDTALLLAAYGFQQQPGPESRQALLSVVGSAGSEFQYLWNHAAPLLSVALSPDGRYLATGAKDGSILLWNALTRVPLGPPWTGHDGEVNAVAFSPDSRLLASASSDRTVQLWEVETRKAAGPALRAHKGAVLGLAFSRDGQWLATASSDKTAILWDLAKRTPTGPPLSGHRADVWKVAFSPDSKTLASAGGEGTVLLWDAATGSNLTTLAAGPNIPVMSLAFSPDGALLAAAGGDRLIRLWNLSDRRPITPPLSGHQGAIWALSFSPDSKTLASGGQDKTVRLWDIPRRAALRGPLAAHTGSVWGVTFASDGRTLASAGDDSALVLWNLNSRTPLGQPILGHEAGSAAALFTPDGKTILSASDDRSIRLWDSSTRLPLGAPLLGHKDAVKCLALSPDGRLLASGANDGSILLWNLESRQPVGPPLLGHTGRVWSVAFSPDGRKLASAGSDHSILLWDVASRKPIGNPLLGHQDFVGCVVFSPKGDQLASASWDKTVRLWDVATGTPSGMPLAQGKAVVASLAYSRDGQLLALGSLDNTVSLWSVADAKPVGPVLTGHKAPVVSVAFSPDGTLLASGSLDNTVQLWDPRRSLPFGRPLHGHSDGVHSVAFSPKGQSLVSASEDKSLVVWNLDPQFWLKAALRMANRKLTADEHRKYLEEAP